MKSPLKGDKGITLAEKREVSMWGLIIASGVCGLLFGQYFKVYSLIGAELVLAGIAYFLACQQGWAIGVLSFVLATVAIQLCYFLSGASVSSWMTSSPPKHPPKNFSDHTENSSGQRAASVGGLFHRSISNCWPKILLICLSYSPWSRDT
jgi:hypothetical protein